MDRLNTSYLDADKYPENLISPGRFDYQLREYRQRLENSATRLFCDERNAKVIILQLGEGKDDFETHEVYTLSVMQDILQMQNRHGCRDPICRFLFFHARNSRDRLFTTQKMFTDALTCHQVMPEFLDFVFPFGKREDAEDFHFGALKTDHRLGNPRTAISIPELGRSGQQYQMCYNIRSVEPYKGDSTWPWSIRQCAIFHSFDVENGRTVWIMIKGNLRMRNRIAEAVKSNNMDETSSIRSYKSVSASFASSLNVHSNLCDMATDNWRWYINFLEGEFQKLTRYALHAPVETTSMAQAHLRAPIRSDTAPLPRIQRQWSLIPGQRWLARSQKSQTVRSAGMDDPESVNILLEQRNEKSNVKVPDDGDFSFSKLQGIQHLEEKANEALLVIEMNVNILQELSVYYTDLEHRQIWPANFRDETVEVLSQFQKLVSSAVSDFKMQQSRLETLIRMLSNRKDLLFGILNHRNVLMNQQTSVEARESAIKMEKMTSRMEDIALKTEEETVSMRIVTYVTLFFLPGTFVSTVMSTDILQYPTDNGVPTRTFSLGALEVWIAITLPLMAVTFFSSHLIRRRENQRAWKRRNKLD